VHPISLISIVTSSSVIWIFPLFRHSESSYAEICPEPSVSIAIKLVLSSPTSLEDAIFTIMFVSVLLREETLLYYVSLRTRPSLSSGDVVCSSVSQNFLNQACWTALAASRRFSVLTTINLEIKSLQSSETF